MSFSVHAGDEPTIPPPRPQAQKQQQKAKGSPVASHILAKTPEAHIPLSAEDEADCQALVTQLTHFTLNSDNLAKLREEKVAVDAALAEDIRNQYQLYSVTEMRAIKTYERVLLLLARGDTRELVPLLRPVFGAVYRNYHAMRGSLNEQDKLRADTSEEGKKKLAEEKARFIAAAKPFGENYGSFINFKRLLTKVSISTEENPVADAADAAELAGVPADAKILLNLNSKRARDAAKSALEILTSETEQQWLVSSTKRVPSDRAVSIMYTHNMDAILAYQKKHLDEQRNSRNLFLKGVQHIANFYMNLTDRTWVPERYRAVILRLLGVAYNQVMLERHLDKIQAVIDVTRIVSPNGNIVLTNDEESMELQIITLREMRAATIGNDFLKTFAALGWRSREWMALRSYVKAKAEETKTDTTFYVDLLADMVDAENSRKHMKELPFTYEPAVRHELILATTQLAWIVGQEEFWRRWGAQWVHNAANYFF